MTAITDQQVLEAQLKTEHWRAVLAKHQRPSQLHTRLHVVGFRDYKACEGFVASERDMNGWHYTIEELVLRSDAEAAIARARIEGGGEGVPAGLSKDEIDKLADRHLRYQIETSAVSGIYDFASALLATQRESFLKAAKWDALVAEGRELAIPGTPITTAWQALIIDIEDRLKDQK
jgi:hypothetical protein